MKTKLSKNVKANPRGGQRVHSTKLFCRCPDCGRRLKRESETLRHCKRCRQSFSDPYLKGYWLGVERTKRHNAAGEGQPPAQPQG